MTTKYYNQANTSVSYNGYNLKGLGSGTSISVEIIGGEVSITEGTDGGSMNLSTEQGARVTLIFKETSDSLPVIESFRQSQKLSNTTSGVMVITTGADILYTLNDCLIGKPETLSTGDKEMGSISISFVSTSFNVAY